MKNCAYARNEFTYKKQQAKADSVTYNGFVGWAGSAGGGGAWSRLSRGRAAVSGQSWSRILAALASDEYAGEWEA